MISTSISSHPQPVVGRAGLFAAASAGDDGVALRTRPFCRCSDALSSIVPMNTNSLLVSASEVPLLDSVRHTSRSSALFNGLIFSGSRVSTNLGLRWILRLCAAAVPRCTWVA